VVEAFSLPLVSTLLDKLVVLVVDPRERARIMGLLFVLVILLTTPFGWIGGQLSELNPGPAVRAADRAVPHWHSLLTVIAGRLIGERDRPSGLQRRSERTASEWKWAATPCRCRWCPVLFSRQKHVSSRE